jgi:hypothetical protein
VAPIQLQRPLVERLDRQVDLRRAAIAGVAHPPAEELAAEPATAPRGPDADEVDPALECSVVVGTDLDPGEADEPVRIGGVGDEEDPAGIEVRQPVDVADDVERP